MSSSHIDAAHAAPQTADLPTVTDGLVDTIDTLLLSVGHGSQEAFVALQSRMAGLVRVNICRVLHDATRSESVTRATFDDVRVDAVHFDPDQNSAQTWLLTRAHQHATDELHAHNNTHNPPGPTNTQPTPAVHP